MPTAVEPPRQTTHVERLTKKEHKSERNQPVLRQSNCGKQALEQQHQARQPRGCVGTGSVGLKASVEGSLRNHILRVCSPGVAKSLMLNRLSAKAVGQVSSPTL